MTTPNIPQHLQHGHCVHCGHRKWISWGIAEGEKGRDLVHTFVGVATCESCDAPEKMQ